MATRYRTKTGDTLDWICWKFYGSKSGAVEQVLESNPKLALLPPELPEDIEIVLPELSITDKGRGVKLWD